MNRFKPSMRQILYCGNQGLMECLEAGHCVDAIYFHRVLNQPIT